MNVNDAMLNLQLPQYIGIRTVFGKALEMRKRQAQPCCTLFTWLALKAHPLELLNEDCETYVAEIGAEDAQRKCNADVLGNARRPFSDFNGSCGDFWAEMAAIRVLRDAGYSRFRAVHKQLPDGTTSDYAGYRGDSLAYIEVKNIRANLTMLDAFDREIRRRHEAEPSQFEFNVAVEYPYDNPPTAEQERRVVAFIESIRGLKPPFERELDLVDAVSRITVRDGGGTALMTRGWSWESPEPIKKDWFLSKVRAKAEDAASQMRDDARLKVLVINFDSPSGSLSSDFVVCARQTMQDAFGGSVDPYFLLYRHHLQL